MSSFIDFARAHGVQIEPSRFHAGDKIRRCGTVDKPKSTNGAWFWDGARGFVWNWAGESRPQWFEDQNAKPWSDAEKRQWAARRRAAQQEQAQGHQRAALRAAEMIAASKPVEHNYLHMKGFPSMLGMVNADGDLLIPMRHLATNELQGVQVIKWVEFERRYDKKMIPGMRAKGAVFRIGPKQAQETFLVEGYATGLSVEAALRSIGFQASVLVCFSANNMEHVAPMVSGRVFVFADNDKSGTGEAAAIATGRPYCMSPEIGEDANDLHKRGGLMAVCKLLMEVRRQ